MNFARRINTVTGTKKDSEQHQFYTFRTDERYSYNSLGIEGEFTQDSRQSGVKGDWAT